MATETGFIQFVEGSVPSTPATGKWRVYTKTTGLFIVDDAGTEYGPLAADGSAAHIADTTDAHDASAVSFDATGLDNTTATEVQTALEEFDAAITSGGGGGAPDCKEAYLGADVPCVNADTFYDGPTVSLGAGTWEVEGRLQWIDANSSATGCVARLSDGTNHFASAMDHKPSGASLIRTTIVSARITLGSTTTIKAQLSSARGSSSTTIQTTGGLTGGVANKASRIRAIAVTSA